MGCICETIPCRDCDRDIGNMTKLSDCAERRCAPNLYHPLSLYKNGVSVVDSPDGRLLLRATFTKTSGFPITPINKTRNRIRLRICRPPSAVRISSGLPLRRSRHHQRRPKTRLGDGLDESGPGLPPAADVVKAAISVTVCDACPSEGSVDAIAGGGFVRYVELLPSRVALESILPCTFVCALPSTTRVPSPRNPSGRRRTGLFAGRVPEAKSRVILLRPVLLKLVSATTTSAMQSIHRSKNGDADLSAAGWGGFCIGGKVLLTVGTRNAGNEREFPRASGRDSEGESLNFQWHSEARLAKISVDSATLGTASERGLCRRLHARGTDANAGERAPTWDCNTSKRRSDVLLGFSTEALPSDSWLSEAAISPKGARACLGMTARKGPVGSRERPAVYLGMRTKNEVFVDGLLRPTPATCLQGSNERNRQAVKVSGTLFCPLLFQADESVGDAARSQLRIFFLSSTTLKPLRCSAMLKRAANPPWASFLRPTCDVAQTVDVDAVEEIFAVGPAALEPTSREETPIPAALQAMADEDMGAPQTGSLDGVSPPSELVENAVAAAREDEVQSLDHATHPHHHNLLAPLTPNPAPNLPIFHGADTGTEYEIEYSLEVPQGQSTLGELVYLIQAGGASFHSNLVGDPAMLNRPEVQAQLATAFAQFLFDPNPRA
uniref:Uncharacterized protein n=1 Tax=Mycena chlorophos TaxID=658473 RepID=A0ABQ0LAE9_MYCCL|nr:predicted protein [Mycena chlorophos]